MCRHDKDKGHPSKYEHTMQFAHNIVTNFMPEILPRLLSGMNLILCMDRESPLFAHAIIQQFDSPFSALSAELSLSPIEFGVTSKAHCL